MKEEEIKREIERVILENIKTKKEIILEKKDTLWT